MELGNVGTMGEHLVCVARLWLEQALQVARKITTEELSIGSAE